MDLNDLYGAGSDIMDAVNDAVRSSGMSESIMRRTGGKISEADSTGIQRGRAPQITAPTLTEGISLQEPDTASA